MNLIPCSADCSYQSEGYCTLHQAAGVNSLHRECVYFTPRKEEAPPEEINQ
ncbi:MAG TPA: hypothetical protein IAD07_00625 [Candidatus Fimivicinus intestinavium]|nr:hypothetical protein [Candidatus Fimivicinus intestinavium]